MEQFISELIEKRPKYTTKNWGNELVVTLDGFHHVLLNEKLIKEVRFEDLIDFIDREMDKLVNDYKNGTK